VRGRPPDAWVVFSEELRGHLRSRWYVFFTLAVVLILVIAMLVTPLFQDGGGPSGPPAQEDLKRVGFIDDSGSFSAVEGESGPVRYDTRSQGLEAITRGEIDSLYVITADYLSSGRVEQYAKFEGRFPSDPRGEQAFRVLLVQGLIEGRVDPDVATRVLAPADFESFRVGDDGSVAELEATAVAVGGLLVPMLFAGLLALGLTVGSGYMVQNVSGEKESRLVEVVITSASPLSVMAGKLLALASIGLIQAAVWIITAAFTIPAIFDRIPGAGEFTVSAGLWLTIIACFVTGYLLTTTAAILVGAVAPSNREASRLGGWIPLLSFVPFWLASLVLTQPDGMASRILSYVPFVAPTGVLVRISGGGDMGAWQIATALGGVLVTAVVLLWVAARVFRAAILMRGQSLTPHNLWVALRNP
jgi:ABC-2 type transport system permease protein